MGFVVSLSGAAFCVCGAAAAFLGAALRAVAVVLEDARDAVLEARFFGEFVPDLGVTLAAGFFAVGFLVPVVARERVVVFAFGFAAAVLLVLEAGFDVAAVFSASFSPTVGALVGSD